MKFCKNLQQIVEISDPAWAPYWTNYKMLKVCPNCFNIKIYMLGALHSGPFLCKEMRKTFSHLMSTPKKRQNILFSNAMQLMKI